MPMSSSSSSSLASRRVGAHSASSGHLPSVEHTHGGSSSGSSTGSSSKDEAEGNFSHGGGRSHIVIPSSTSSASLLLLSSGPGASSGGSSGSMVGGSSSAFSLKWMALIVLVLQNSSLILFMRASRVGSDADSVYLISTAVAVAEATKLVLASALMFLLDCNANVSTFVSVLRYELFVNWREFMKMCVPSGLYVVQNNLQYLGASHLPAAVFQVLVQMKIITTALFSVTMLSRKLSGMQWLAVVSLGLGIGLVQISQQQSSSSSSREEEEEGQEVSGFAPGLVVSSSMVGIVAVLVSCLTSGFAGVYFEKVLKTNSTSIWMRNIQLAIIGIVISLATVVLGGDLEAVRRDGFLRGYTPVVWTVVMLQAGGGLVVALVVKYADNVIKGFATSISVVLSCVVASLVFQSESNFNVLFLLGAAVVCASALIFSSYPYTAPTGSGSGAGNGSPSGGKEPVPALPLLSPSASLSSSAAWGKI